jgi:predicted amidohydrolase YtcJ
MGDPSLEFGQYKNRLKLGGVKFVTDGSVQGKTGFHTKPLLTGGPAGEKDWVGSPTFPRETIIDLYKKVSDKNIQIWSHANGDAAIDIVIDSAAAAGMKAGDDRRPVVIHSQCMRPDQLESYVKLGLSPSFFTAHTFFWGDVHLVNLGPERASFLSPMKSAAAKGLRFSNHNDFLITPLDPMRMIASAVQRNSRSGVVIGPDERVDVMTAIKALTIHPAWLYREEASKGSIEIGKLADLVILNKNPLTVPVEDILGIQVVETLKEGQTVYAVNQKAGAIDYKLSPRRVAADSPRGFFSDDCSAPAVGCTCCINGLIGEAQEKALEAITELSEIFV